MRAWKFHDFGDIKKVMTLENVPEPEPDDGEVLIKLERAALNPADKLLVEGNYPGAGKPPLSVGRDGAGVVARSKSDRFREGDEVAVLRSGLGVVRNGTLAEFVSVPAESVAPKPAGWSFDEAAAAPLVHLTAWRALVIHGDLQRGQNVLVTGASGGVGIAAVQQAKLLGANVVALSRSEEKRNRLIDLGAGFAFDPSAENLEDQVRQALDGRGVDLVVENLAGKYLQTSINLCEPRGRIGVIGLLGGRKAELFLGPLLFREIRIEGVAVGAFEPEETQLAWRDILDHLDLGNTRPVVDRVFPMAEVQEAFDLLAGDHMGKIVIDVTA